MASTAGGSTNRLDEFFDDLVRCEVRLYNGLDDRLRAAHGLALSQFEFLQFVNRTPNARVADLAAHFAIGIGATSKGIDRQERLGWVRRSPNPDDRRSSLLSLTPAGADLLAAAQPTYAAGLHELVESVLGASVVDQLAATLATLRSELQIRNIGAPTG